MTTSTAIYLAFEYADGIHTMTGGQSYNKTTGEFRGLCIAGSLVAFDDEAERDEWVGEGNGARCSTGYGPGSKHRESIDIDDLPSGWRIEDAEPWDPSFDRGTSAIEDTIRELAEQRREEAGEEIEAAIKAWKPEDGCGELADLLNRAESEGIEIDPSEIRWLEARPGYEDILPCDWAYALDTDGRMLVLVAGTTDDGWTASDPKEFEDEWRTVLERGGLEGDELEEAVKDKLKLVKIAP